VSADLRGTEDQDRIEEDPRDLRENYLVGQEFWSYGKTQKDGELYRRAYQYLLNTSDSPRNLNSWDLQLRRNGN
jgi:hypothetical protein